MQPNYKLKLALDKLGGRPQKKTYDYYKITDNLWNSKYLSSPKISKYYLDAHEKYMSGPFSPKKLSLMESTERNKEYKEKAIVNRLKSRQMLIERKKERENIQDKSKQPKVIQNKSPKTLMSMSMDFNYHYQGKSSIKKPSINKSFRNDKIKKTVFLFNSRVRFNKIFNTKIKESRASKYNKGFLTRDSEKSPETVLKQESKQRYYSQLKEIMDDIEDFELKYADRSKNQY